MNTETNVQAGTTEGPLNIGLLESNFQMMLRKRMSL
jgi:hypothetical protein